MGGEAAGCVCSVGCDAGWLWASAINEVPNTADSKHIPKSCCLTKPSSMHNPSAPVPGKSKTTLSPYGDRRDSQRVKTAPIVSAHNLSRVRKTCRTISYTICVVTVFKDGVKRTMSPVPLALIWTRRQKSRPTQATFDAWCSETNRNARIIKKRLDDPVHTAARRPRDPGRCAKIQIKRDRGLRAGHHHDAPRLPVGLGCPLRQPASWPRESTSFERPATYPCGGADPSTRGM